MLNVALARFSHAMQRRCPAEHRLAIALTCHALPSRSRSTLSHRHAQMRSAYAWRVHALPPPSESMRCRRRAAQLRAGQCLAVARRCESAHCRCLACPYYAAAPQAVELPCAIAMPSLSRRSPATQRLAHALRIGAMPVPCATMPQHCRSIHGQSGDAPIVAPAAPCQASPPHCQASPMHCRAKLRHRTVLLCHRVAPNAAQFLAIALQV